MFITAPKLGYEVEIRASFLFLFFFFSCLGASACTCNQQRMDLGAESPTLGMLQIKRIRACRMESGQYRAQ